MYRLIDWLYFNFYWCWNTDKNGRLKDVTLSNDIMILLWGILFIIFSLIVPTFSIRISAFALFVCVGASAFVLSNLIMRKYNDERKVKILNKFERPGNSKFVVFALFTIICALICISSYFIGMNIIENIKYNR